MPYRKIAWNQLQLELAHYFQYEPDPKGQGWEFSGTRSPEDAPPPQFDHGAVRHVMMTVYRRLKRADEIMPMLGVKYEGWVLPTKKPGAAQLMNRVDGGRPSCSMVFRAMFGTGGHTYMDSAPDGVMHFIEARKAYETAAEEISAVPKPKRPERVERFERKLSDMRSELVGLLRRLDAAL